MAYLQPRTNNYFGFMPTQEGARTNIYVVSATEGERIVPGDVVVWSTDGATVRRQANLADASLTVGIAASVVTSNGGSSNADIRVLTSQSVLVYDDPHQLYVTCDTTSGVFGWLSSATAIGKAVSVAATGVTGSTGVNPTLNRSVMAVSIVTASSGSTAAWKFRILGIHPVEGNFSTIITGTAAAATEVRKLIVKPEFHAFLPGHSGTAHVTT